MRAPGPGVLGGGVEGGAGEIEPDADVLPAAGVADEALGFEAGQQAQRLGVALEAAAVRGEVVEGLFAVVAEGRVAHVVGEAGRLDEVGVAAEGGAELPADLGALQGVGEPGARAGVPGPAQGAGRDDLGLAREPAQGGGVQHPCAVALEGGAAGLFVGLGVPALGVGCAVGRVPGVVRTVHGPDIRPTD